MRELLLLLLALVLFAQEACCRTHSEDDDLADWPAIAELNARRLEKSPQDEKAWAGLVEARLNDRDLKHAQIALRSWRSKVAKPAPEIERLTATAAVQANEYPQAIEAYEKYVRLVPNNSDGWTGLATAYEHQRDWLRAIDALSKALEIAPGVQLYTRRARYFMSLHEWDKAKADLQEAYRIDATDKEMLALYLIFERSQKWLPQVKKLDAAIQANPTDAALRLDRAEQLMAAGLDRDFDLPTYDDIEEAFKLNPNSLRARYWHGSTALGRDDKQQAGAVMPMGNGTSPEFRAGLKAMDTEPEAEKRARFLLKHKQPLMALREVEKVTDSPARAHALLNLTRLPEAGRVARRAVKAHPDDPWAWLVMAQIEVENGNYKEALAALEHCSREPEAKGLREIAQRRLGK